MAGVEKRKGGGAKTSRSETVTVRLEPKLRYLAELAARKQRRTLSSFIEWAIEATLERETLYSYDSAAGPMDATGAEAANDLWDVDEADRFVMLAVNVPSLLTHDEQVLWKLIKETPYVWKNSDKAVIDFQRLRECWDTLKAVSGGEADRSSLPT